MKMRNKGHWEVWKVKTLQNEIENQRQGLSAISLLCNALATAFILLCRISAPSRPLASLVVVFVTFWKNAYFARRSDREP
jgi:hypothetical protein